MKAEAVVGPGSGYQQNVPDPQRKPQHHHPWSRLETTPIPPVREQHGHFEYGGRPHHHPSLAKSAKTPRFVFGMQENEKHWWPSDSDGNEPEMGRGISRTKQQKHGFITLNRSAHLAHTMQPPSVTQPCASKMRSQPLLRRFRTVHRELSSLIDQGSALTFLASTGLGLVSASPVPAVADFDLIMAPVACACL